jgi:hypothetical protein
VVLTYSNSPERKSMRASIKSLALIGSGRQPAVFRQQPPLKGIAAMPPGNIDLEAVFTPEDR